MDYEQIVIGTDRYRLMPEEDFLDMQSEAMAPVASPPEKQFDIEEITLDQILDKPIIKGYFIGSGAQIVGYNDEDEEENRESPDTKIFSDVLFVASSENDTLRIR